MIGLYKFIGFDALPEAVRAVKEGRLTATIAQKPDDMGRITMSTVARFLNGNDIEAFISIDLKLVN